MVWKRVCSITDVSNLVRGTQEKPDFDRRNCIIEMSRSKTRFWIIAVDLLTHKYSVLELFRT